MVQQKSFNFRLLEGQKTFYHEQMHATLTQTVQNKQINKVKPKQMIKKKKNPPAEYTWMQTETGAQNLESPH